MVLRAERIRCTRASSASWPRSSSTTLCRGAPGVDAGFGDLRRQRRAAGQREPGSHVADPGGGQVPWHNQEQEEVYFVVQGEGEICLGTERRALSTGQAVYIPSRVHHQLTNTGETPLTMIYVYAPAGDVAHWRQELDGTLPRAGIEAPALPAGAHPQCTEKPA